MSDHASPDTYFAPAARAEAADLQAAREAFLSNDLAVTLLEAIPDPAMVLNAQRQIIAANAQLREALGVDSGEAVLGLRPGEAVRCAECPGTPSGCGTGPLCLHCGAVHAIMESLEHHTRVSHECRLRTDGVNGRAQDLEVQATFVRIAGADMTVVSLRDVSAERRRLVLERVFFHDVLNTATALSALAAFVDSGRIPPELEGRWPRDLRRISDQMVEEIVAQRALLAAERGDLHPSFTTVHVPELLESVLARHRPMSQEDHFAVRLAEVSRGPLVTDPILLRRVLSNLVKNALEALSDGGIVTVRAREEAEAVVFEVHNPGVMPPEVQQQIFQRSFSTKAGRGRGLGTYSIRLFTERHLGGRVSFESRTPEGTTFRVTLPKQGPNTANR